MTHILELVNLSSSVLSVISELRQKYPNGKLYLLSKEVNLLFLI